MNAILYIIIPCYNEETVLPITSKMFLDKLTSLIQSNTISNSSRILFVNDGSKDKTWEIICNLAKQDEHFIGISQSRNRGHQNAVLAGLMEAKDKCDITISIDCDGQDDISAMESMIKEYLDGFMHIQISTNSTNEDERKYLFGGADVVTIEEMKKEFNNMPNNNRLITLNFICGAGWELDPNKLYGLDPNVFCVKITPLNITTATKEHGLKDAIQWNWENMNKIKEKVESCGLKVVVDVAAKAELPLCCGNLVQDYKNKK